MSDPSSPPGIATSEERFPCPSCGAELRRGSILCPACGTSFLKPTPASPPARPDVSFPWTPEPSPGSEGTGRPTSDSRLAVVAVVIGAVSILANLALFVFALSDVSLPRLPAAVAMLLESLRTGGAVVAFVLAWTAIERIEVTRDKRGLYAAHLARTLAITSLVLLAARWLLGRLFA